MNLDFAKKATFTFSKLFLREVAHSLKKGEGHIVGPGTSLTKQITNVWRLGLELKFIIKHEMRAPIYYAETEIHHGFFLPSM